MKQAQWSIYFDDGQIPIENKRSFFDVSAEVLENVDPIFYGEVKQGVFKALGLV